MAFYRCGGGGIPSSLKTDMNAVLNKKFGTSSDYPPADWPDTVNLMGPLPEKTIVSSPIADFSDGADDVPTKSLVVTIPPTLSGVSSVTETQTGKNLFSYDMTIYSGYWTSTAFSGTGTAYDDYDDSTGWCFVKVPVKEGSTITISGMEARSGVYSAFIGDAVSDIIQTILNYNINGTKTVPTGAKYLGIIVYRGGTPKNDPKTTYPNGQVEVGSSASAYEPYQTPTQYTASLGRTINGGEVDIVNGTGKDGYVKPVITSSMVNTAALESQNRIWRVLLTTEVYDGNFIYQVGLCNLLTFVTSYGDVANNDMSIAFNINTGKQILLHNSNLTTVDEVKAFIDTLDIVYPLATPTDFTFDGQEVPTRLGYNAFWSDQGDTEITYRADINLALGGQ